MGLVSSSGARTEAYSQSVSDRQPATATTIAATKAATPMAYTSIWVEFYIIVGMVSCKKVRKKLPGICPCNLHMNNTREIILQS